MNLYPLKFQPILQERLWGGTKLKEVLGKPSTGDTTAESWELSGVPGNISIVSNGHLAGRSLTELIQEYKADLLGERIYSQFGNEFPILIKFIDAKMDLSIQVHPGDELARKRHNSYGKTEMWYVMDSDKDARLIIGFNADTNREAYEKSLSDGTLPSLLHNEIVSEGDTFFIRPGTIHAIGAGVMLAEIQQTSDLTYRVYDFNRKDKDGNLRELHTDLALEALDYKCRDDFKVPYSRQMNQVNLMVHSPYFKTDYLELTKSMDLDVSGQDSFTILLCVAGSTYLSNEVGSTEIRKGETVLVPAATKLIQLKTTGAKLLKVTL